MLEEQTIKQYLTELSAKKSTPGGGAVAAVIGSQAAGLIAMVAEFSHKSIDTNTRTALVDSANKAAAEFLTLADQDSENFKALMACYKSNSGIEAASKTAAEPPLSCLKLAAELVPLVITLNQSGNKNLETDTAIAAMLIVSTIRASELNVLINLRSISDTVFTDTAGRAIESAKTHISTLEAIASGVLNELSVGQQS